MPNEKSATKTFEELVEENKKEL
ncbi:FbpB family small basic protein [Anaerobacillus sp. HL2]|nr:FbpB family small basic protein [Anaerobacillus sp. HL2]